MVELPSDASDDHAAPRCARRRRRRTAASEETRTSAGQHRRPELAAGGTAARAVALGSSTRGCCTPSTPGDGAGERTTSWPWDWSVDAGESARAHGGGGASSRGHQDVTREECSSSSGALLRLERQGGGRPIELPLSPLLPPPPPPPASASSVGVARVASHQERTPRLVAVRAPSRHHTTREPLPRARNGAPRGETPTRGGGAAFRSYAALEAGAADAAADAPTSAAATAAAVAAATPPPPLLRSVVRAALAAARADAAVPFYSCARGGPRRIAAVTALVVATHEARGSGGWGSPRAIHSTHLTVAPSLSRGGFLTTRGRSRAKPFSDGASSDNPRPRRGHISRQNTPSLPGRSSEARSTGSRATCRRATRARYSAMSRAGSRARRAGRRARRRRRRRGGAADARRGRRVLPRCGSSRSAPRRRRTRRTAAA